MTLFRLKKIAVLWKSVVLIGGILLTGWVGHGWVARYLIDPVAHAAEHDQISSDLDAQFESQAKVTHDLSHLHADLREMRRDLRYLAGGHPLPALEPDENHLEVDEEKALSERRAHGRRRSGPEAAKPVPTPTPVPVQTPRRESAPNP